MAAAILFAGRADHWRGFLQVARAIGLSYSATCRVIGRFNAGGMKALAPHKRGRRVSDKRVLTSEQEAHIQKLICEHQREQLKGEYALSCIAVGQLIQRE